MLQAEDRAHRIGQNNCVNIYYLFGEETLDEIIYPMIQFKGHIVSKSLDGQQSDFKMKKRKDEDDDNKNVMVKSMNEIETKLEDDKDYFANDTNDYRSNANYEGREQDENPENRLGPEGP